MIFDITPEQEQKINQWMFLHIWNEHFEFSAEEKESAETDSSQFSFVIHPAYIGYKRYDGYVCCNYCGAQLKFASKEDN